MEKNPIWIKMDLSEIPTLALINELNERGSDKEVDLALLRILGKKLFPDTEMSICAVYKTS